ncbi:MAG: DUF2855 family protein [Alphaproteobacteria bacterium]|nr:DUF2855 family protein [Alphaproteobacteria bacterium]
MAGAHDLLVSRKALAETRLSEGEIPALDDGEALLRVDAFALTANNVTYGAFGDAMRYWNFFPAEAGWGRVPVWGFATVLGSKAEGVSPGKRVYGYLPMSTHLKVKPERVSAAGFNDGADHRRDLPAAYQRYTFCDTDPLYTPESEALQMIYRPLFTTSFLLDDLLVDNALYGAKQVLVSSASSKTAFGMAQLLHHRGVDVIGLTAPRNARFAALLDVYKRVVTYPDIATLDGHVATAFVDIAGNADVRARVHRHYGDALKLSLQVGATHWEQGAGADSLPGPKPEFFFAPDRITKRIADWGADGFAARSADAFANFLPSAAASTKIVVDRGLEAAGRVFAAHATGAAFPRDGHIIDLR